MHADGAVHTVVEHDADWRTAVCWRQAPALCEVIMKSPSPATLIDVRSGATIDAITAAGTP